MQMAPCRRYLLRQGAFRPCPFVPGAVHSYGQGEPFCWGDLFSADRAPPSACAARGKRSEALIKNGSDNRQGAPLNRPPGKRRGGGKNGPASRAACRYPALLGPAHAASIAGGDRHLEAAGSAQKQHIRLGVKQPGKPASHKPAAGTHKARLSESPGRLERNPPNRAFPLPASLESSPASPCRAAAPRKLRSPAP